MEKLIKTICGLFFILCLSSKSYADPKSLSGYPWDLQQMPIWCGPLEMVNEALKNEGYEEFEIAFGRIAALPEGEIAYAVMTYASKNIEGHIIRTGNTCSTREVCIRSIV